MTPVQEPEETLTYWAQHRFLLLIGITLVVAFILVTISLVIYNLSGAAQLDLSRPGYIGVSQQAVNGAGEFENYSASGSINRSSIDDFKKLYDKQAQSANSVDAFGGDPLDPDSLEFGVTTTE